jgi:PAS domain S-box-containing protein
MTAEERCAAGRELRELVDFGGFFEENPVPMWIYDAESLRILDANVAALAHFGYTRRELLAMTVLDVRPPEEVPRFLDHLGQSGGERCRAQGRWRLRKKDGALVDVEITWSDVRFGASVARLATLHDVTERGRADERLRFQALLLANVSDAVLACDVDWVLTSWNEGAEAIYGWSAADVLGRPMREVFRGALNDRATADALRALVEVGQFCGEIAQRRQDGTPIRVEVRASALAADDGTRLGYVAVIRDVTARRRAEETVRALLHRVVTAQEDERRRVARELHDDAAQLLAGLYAGLQAVQGAATLDDARRGCADMRLQLSRALKEIQRIAKGLRPAVLDDLGLSEALKRLAAECTRAHGIPVEVVVPDAKTPRLALPLETTFYRIAQEAVTNAVRHSGATRISVILARGDTRGQLIVEDDGCGFREDVAAPKGRLGLTGMRERAALVGGTVTVESQPGRGTSIHVVVPIGGTR